MNDDLAVLRTLASDLADKLPADIEDLAASAVAELDEAVLRSWSTQLLISEARYVWRNRTLALERAAERSRNDAALRARQEVDAALLAAQRAELYLGKYKHGSMDQRTGAVPMGCTCDRCEEVGEIEARHARRRHEAMARSIREFERELRLEWTNELLAAGFALPDGTTTTWGDATIDQHRSRLEMLTANAVANADAAARHMKAIDEIEAAGCSSLNELRSTSTGGRAAES